MQFRTVPNIHLFGTGSAGARKVYFEDLNQDMFLKSKMKHAGTYDIYSDILLMVSICVLTYDCVKENPDIQTYCLNFQPTVCART